MGNKLDKGVRYLEEQLGTEGDAIDLRPIGTLGANMKGGITPYVVEMLLRYRKIDMNNMQISALPPQIGQLTALTSLQLERNKLGTLPAELGELSQLTTLNLFRAKLTALPDELCRVTALQRLVVHKNSLSKLPEGIGACKYLALLYCGGNKIGNLPASLYGCIHLLELHVQENQLTDLDGISRLTKLRVLNARGNKIVDLDPNMGCCTALTTVILFDNKIAVLPESIGLCTQITKLSIQNNKLTELPLTLVNLKGLEEFNVGSNPLQLGFKRFRGMNAEAAMAAFRELSPEGAVVRREAGRRSSVVPDALLDDIKRTGSQVTESTRKQGYSTLTMLVETLAWVEAVLGEEAFTTTLTASQRSQAIFSPSYLIDGVILCLLMNKVRQGAVPKVYLGQGLHGGPRRVPRSQATRNIERFLDACAAYHLHPDDVFKLDDLLRGFDLPRVYHTIAALAVKATARGFGISVVKIPTTYQFRAEQIALCVSILKAREAGIQIRKEAGVTEPEPPLERGRGSVDSNPDAATAHFLPAMGSSLASGSLLTGGGALGASSAGAGAQMVPTGSPRVKADSDATTALASEGSNFWSESPGGSRTQIPGGAAANPADSPKPSLPLRPVRANPKASKTAALSGAAPNDGRPETPPSPASAAPLAGTTPPSPATQAPVSPTGASTPSSKPPPAASEAVVATPAVTPAAAAVVVKAAPVVPGGKPSSVVKPAPATTSTATTTATPASPSSKVPPTLPGGKPAAAPVPIAAKPAATSPTAAAQSPPSGLNGSASSIDLGSTPTGTPPRTFSRARVSSRLGNKSEKEFANTVRQRLATQRAQTRKRGLRQEWMSETWQLEATDCVFQRQLGQGAFGVVYKADYLGVEVAVKEIHNDGTLDPEVVSALARMTDRELTILKQLQHPNLLKFIGTFQHPERKTLCLVTEYVPNSSVAAQVDKMGNTLDKRIVLKIAKETASGLAYLHENHIIHRDIKSENLLLGDNWRVKVCDFGFARVMGESKGAVNGRKARAMTLCGTDDYMAPEVILGMDYFEAADIFSYGLTMLELFVGEKSDASDVLRRTPQNAFDLDFNAIRANMRTDLPAELVDVIFACADYDPNKRPALSDVVVRLEKLEGTMNQTMTADKLNEVIATLVEDALPGSLKHASLRRGEFSLGAGATPLASDDEDDLEDDDDEEDDFDDDLSMKQSLTNKDDMSTLCEKVDDLLDGIFTDSVKN